MRILVVDDHGIIRLGLKQLLESRSGWEICGEAATGNEAVMLAKRFEPHVVVIDIGMPELNGIEATRKIRELLPQTRIVILTMHFSDQLIGEIVEAGARGYILKSDADRELEAARDKKNRRSPRLLRGIVANIIDCRAILRSVNPSACP